MKKTELMRTLGKAIAGIGTLALAAFVAVVPVKADVISEAQSGYDRGMAYLISTQYRQLR